MVRTIFMALLGIALAASVCSAGSVNKTIISSTVLDNSPTHAYSSVFNIQDYKRVGFYVSYAEQEHGSDIFATMQLKGSYDGTNFFGVNFYDYGAATIQHQQVFTVNDNYYCWLDPDMALPYIKMEIVSTNTNVSETATVSAYMAGIK